MSDAQPPETPPEPNQAFRVELPGGGPLFLLNEEEVALWTDSVDQYKDDYGFTKQNDLVLLGMLVSQQVIAFRAQSLLFDEARSATAGAKLEKAAEEMRKIEKALGIDKKSREAGGQHTVDDYVTNLKRWGAEMGLHIVENVKAYEKLFMELRWKLRVLRNADSEDREHHGISEKSIIAWLEVELGELEQKDKEWAQERGKLFVGSA